MFDTLMIGTSGLLGHAKGLRIVGNNLANVNTPGFKGAQLQFADLFEQGGGGALSHASGGAASAGASLGTGLNTLGSQINFKAGLDQATGNALDLAISGNGFYAVRRDGAVLYTRSGDFQFDDKGVLVNGSGDHVLGLDAGGQLVDVTIGALEHSTPKVTTKVTLDGNLTTVVATPAVDASISGIVGFDPNGGSHSFSATVHDAGSGNFTVTVKDASGATVGTGTVKYAAGLPVTGSTTVSFINTVAGLGAYGISLDFSGTTATVDVSALSMASQDGYAPGSRTDQTIDSDGQLSIHYSNGQSAKGARLALASFAAETDLEQAAGSTFTVKDGAKVHYGYAKTGSFGSLSSGHREGSNVDLAEEFSNLILMQRGYQASSHVISTANDMIQELFDMKGHR